MKTNVSRLLAAASMAVLILDSATALQGAREGVQLCISTVIPSLFPFCFLSIWLTDLLSGAPLPQGLGKLFHFSPGTEAVMITGFLGGYPMGVQSLMLSHRSGSISRTDANMLLRFCSQPGPAFIFGILGSQFPSPLWCWGLWIIVLAGAWAVSLLREPAAAADRMQERNKLRPAAAILRQAVTSMAMISGWIIVFRVIIRFLTRWVLWLLPQEWHCLLSGLLELTNGCCMLGNVADLRLRFILSAALLSCGGLCVAMQTASLAAPLDMKHYVFGKLIQCSVCTSLAAAVFDPVWAVPVIAVFSFAILRKRYRKNSSISGLIHV